MNRATISKSQPVISSPFARTRALLADIKPGREPIDMSIGEPRHGVPGLVADALKGNLQGFGKYPLIRGTRELQHAIADWIMKRYPVLAGRIDPSSHVLPLSGSREGLFSAVFTARARRPDCDEPCVLIPNPFYQCYLAGALSAQCQPVFLPTTREGGFLPDLESLDGKVLDRTIAFFLCSPSNPQGAVAGEAYWTRLIELAEKHDFMIFADECYSEVYTRSAPLGSLEVAGGRSGNFKHLVAFNSLSKRSNVPGLRSGFVAGDADFIAEYANFRNVAGPQIPVPLQDVSAALWQDEAHVEDSRRQYVEKFDAVDTILDRKFDYSRPDGGFFLWLDMHELGGSEQAVVRIWEECGIKTIPGAYLAQGTAAETGDSPDYVRIALVQDLATTEKALKRIVKSLGLKQS
ncbi:MAG: aminotransferase class I/II-fold pyridoxal phosphate-dependent enzyme [Methyloligellaceae bacterium]